MQPITIEDYFREFTSYFPRCNCTQKVLDNYDIRYHASLEVSGKFYLVEFIVKAKEAADDDFMPSFKKMCRDNLNKLVKEVNKPKK